MRSGSSSPAGVLAWTAALLIAGAVSFFRLPMELLPSLELSALVINVAWPGASPESVEQQVLQPVEEAIQGLRGTEEIASYASAGYGTLELRVSSQQALGPYASALADRLAALESRLPEGVAPRIDRVAPAALRRDEGFMTLDLSGPLPERRLRQLAEDVVKPRLRSLPGITRVRIDGGDQQEITIRCLPDRLRAYGVDVSTVAAAVREAVGEQHYGWLRGPPNLLVYSGAIHSVESLRNLPLARSETASPLRLRDVARVDLQTAAADSTSRVDGLPAISLSLEREPGSNLLEAADRVHALLPELRAELGAEVLLRVAVDSSRRVRAELTDLGWRGAIGWLFIALVLRLMLARGRAVVLVLSSATAALAFGVLLMQPLGLSLNILTAAGLALLVGLLVDNSTVVVERYLAVRDGDAKAREMRAHWIPLLGGTVSTLAVFVPLVYLSGDLRGLFAPFAVLAAATLVFSLISLRFFLPPLALWLLPTAGTGVPRPRSPRWVLAPYRRVAESRYLPWIVLALVIGLPWPWLPKPLEPAPAGHPMAERYRVFAGSEVGERTLKLLERVLGGVTSPFLRAAKFGHGWRFDRAPELRVRLELPPGSGRERTESLLLPFEELATQSGVARRVLSRIEDDHALMRIIFEDQDLMRPAPFELREETIKRAMSLAGVQVSVTGLTPLSYHGGHGLVHGYLLEASGAGAVQLQRIIARLEEMLERHPRIADVDTHAGALGSWEARPSLRITWDSQARIAGGWSARQLVSTLYPLIPRQAPFYHASLDGDSMLPIRLETTSSRDLDLRQLLSDSSVTADSPAWRHLVKVSEEPQAATIERHNQQYIRYLRVFYRGPDKEGKALIDRALAAQALPPGYTLTRPERTFFNKKVTRQFLVLLGGAVALILLTLAAVLEDWRLAFAALVGIPCAWIGIALTFIGSSAQFAEGAFLGILLVFGIAVNDAVLLIHRRATLRRRHPHRSSAALAAVSLDQRLRPMWATTLTSICGMLPLVLLPGASPFWHAFALTIVGGLVASTLLSPLLLMPLLAARR